MPKPRAKKATSSAVDANGPPIEDAFIDDEVERQCAAIRTIRDVEIDRLHTALSLLRSNLSKEQLQMPFVQFVEENLPNLSLVKSEEDGYCVLKWKDKDGDLSMNTADEGNMISSFLMHMSMAYPGCPGGARPSLGGFDFSSKSVKTSFVGAENQIKDFVLEEASDTHIFGMPDSLQTPGASSQRLSIGMTPKTLRHPKQGEMLLSVHGSPLGLYKENNMDAIHETEEE